MASLPRLWIVGAEPGTVRRVADLLRADAQTIAVADAPAAQRRAETEPVDVALCSVADAGAFLGFLRECRPEAARLVAVGSDARAAGIDSLTSGLAERVVGAPLVAEEMAAAVRSALAERALRAANLRLERELAEASELKRVFSKVASHELRTPLALVVGLAELARAQVEAESPLRPWIEGIHDASLRLRERVDQLGAFLHAGRLDQLVERRETALADVIVQAVEAVRGFLDRRRLALDVDLPPGLGSALIDAEKIHDCVVQLLTNAIKFTPDGGRIRVSAVRSEGEAAIVVADTGHGIAADDQHRLGTPFFTGYDVSRHRSGAFEYARRGLGLGLAVAKTFAQLHGGRIDVVSAPGQGSEFRLVLPLAPAASAG